MKRNLLALAVGVAFVLPLTAQAAPTVYGRLNLSVDYMDIDEGTTTDGSWNLNSNSSRFGIKGNEKLTDEFTAVYKAEWEIQGDTEEANDLNARERYIGLKHYQLGTVRLGNIDSPFKNAEDSVDVFNDHVNLDMQNYIYGQNRLGNSINYVSPKFLDVFGANVSFIPGERNSTPLVGDTTATPPVVGCEDPSAAGSSGAAIAIAAGCNENHISDGVSAAFSYEDDSLYLGVALDKEVADWDAVRVNARYKISDLTASVMYQTAEQSFGASNEQEAIVLSAMYDIGSWTLRGQYLQSNQETDFGLADTSIGYEVNSQVNTVLVGGGIDYNFTKTTKVFGNLASVTEDDKDGGADTKGFLVGAGMETRF